MRSHASRNSKPGGLGGIVSHISQLYGFMHTMDVIDVCIENSPVIAYHLKSLGKREADPRALLRIPKRLFAAGLLWILSLVSAALSWHLGRLDTFLSVPSCNSTWSSHGVRAHTSISRKHYVTDSRYGSFSGQ